VAQGCLVSAILMNEDSYLQQCLWETYVNGRNCVLNCMRTLVLFVRFNQIYSSVLLIIYLMAHAIDNWETE